MVCPICTLAVAVGVGASRELGVSDLITGLWIGALIVSSIMWTISWLDKKNIRFLFRKILVILAFYAIVIIPLYYLGYMGVSADRVFGIDKLLLGTIAGSIIFILAVWSDSYLKNNNEGKVLITYQKVIVPVVFLILSSVIVDLLLKIYGA